VPLRAKYGGPRRWSLEIIDKAGFTGRIMG
jgi:hypothetical protein